MTESISSPLGDALAAIRKANTTWLMSDPPSVKDGLLTWLSHKLGLNHTQSLINYVKATDIDGSRTLEAPYLAALGLYMDSDHIRGDVEQFSWSDSLQVILSREPFTSDRRGIGHNPLVLLGLVPLTLRAEVPESTKSRLKRICADSRANDVAELRKWLCVQIAAWNLGAKTTPCRADQNLSDQADRAMALLTHALFPVETSRCLPAINMAAIRKDLLRHTCLQGTDEQSGFEALLIHAGVELLINQMFPREADPLGTVRSILEGFESAMERWIWDSPGKSRAVRWKVDREEHIQAILFLMLRPLFPDLVYEDPVAKSGVRSSRLDFGIRSLRLGIEVKYVRQQGDFGKVQQEIEADSVGYFANHGLYDQFVVFVYDASRCTERHASLISGIARLELVAGIYVASAPGKMIDT